MKHAAKTDFAEPETGATALAMGQAIAIAKATVGDMTGLPADSVAQCRRDDGGAWWITVDVIESPARIGDNDLLAAYEVQIGPASDLLSFARLRRYHREERDG